MNPITNLVNCFRDNSQEMEITENFNELKTEVRLTPYFKIPSIEELKKALVLFNKRDKLTIDVYFEELDPVTYHWNIDNNLQDFLEKLEHFASMMDDQSQIKLKLLIHKNVDDNFESSIYFFDKFTEHLSKLTLVGGLYTLKQIKRNKPYLKFKILDKKIDYAFGTKTFLFYSSEEISYPIDINRTELLETRNSISNFYNASEYEFVPDDFYLIKKSDSEDFNEFFDKLNTIFSIIFISDFSSIINENDILFKFNGYKLIEHQLMFDDFHVVNGREFYKIYKWIFNGGNISDKVGLARNIISLQLKIENKKLQISTNTINSIKSGYEIYLKENVSQYIEVKNKVSELIIGFAQRITDTANSFAIALKNNTTTFITFFITVIIFNNLSAGKMTDIFTRDITFISYGLLIISFVFLISAIIQANLEKNRLESQYKRLKEMYDDILDSEDLNIIFEKSNYQEELKFIEKRVILYSIVWFLELLILYIVIYILSDYQFL